ncbi:hypothetical protein [Desulfoluna sp.]|uniref:LA_2272 family surface repeat-containing protein n=1 Tax=Desulfoluna sp. TaxID=2045199 RepID=UPI0026068EEC|nr:hypothetical protein [Desulfoluna sp.]
MKMKTLGAFMLILAFLSPGVFAGEAPAGKRWTPAQVSLWPSVQAFGEDRDVYGLRLNFLYGSSADMIGLDLGLVRSRSHEMKGLQVTGIFNECRGNAYGIQVALFGNRVEGDVMGIQLSPLSLLFEPVRNDVGGRLVGLQLGDNEVKGEAIGVQIGWNEVDGDAWGVQLGWNEVEGKMVGLQLAFANNILPWFLQEATTGDLAGLQVALVNRSNRTRGLQIGVFNESASLSGMQLGLYNTADQAAGFQLGLVNWCTEMTGLQVGLVNVIKGGRFPCLPLVNANF